MPKLNPCKHCKELTWSRIKICMECQRKKVHLNIGAKCSVGRIMHERIKRGIDMA